jgi:hypothetical protein
VWPVPEADDASFGKDHGNQERHELPMEPFDKKSASKSQQEMPAHMGACPHRSLLSFATMAPLHLIRSPPPSQAGTTIDAK